MVAAFRAMASVVMLAGFYVVALVQLGASLALAFWLATVASAAVAIKVAIPLLTATVGAVGVALWRAIRARPEPAPGLIVGPDQAPYLWHTVHELARLVGTRVPDEIRVVAEVNAAVSEDSRLLGLIGGRRTLYIGLPLLQAMTVAQLRSILAHELGHYSGQHTRLGAVAYRGRLAMGGTIGRIGPYNPVGWVFRGYARLYLLVDNAVSRRQELEADQASVRVAGRPAAVSALRELPGLAAAWDFYFNRYVEPGWEAGFAPDDLFGGFAALVAARQQELAKIRDETPTRAHSRWDTHPPIAERVSVMAAVPEGPMARDDRPAATLLPDIAQLGYHLQGLLVEVGQRTVLPWPQFTAAWIAAGDQREADVIFRAAARFTASAEVGLPTILELVRAGRLGEFARQHLQAADPQEAAQRFVEPMETLLRTAAVASGAAYWRLSWSGPAQLVGRDGEPLLLDKIAALAVAPQTLDEARRQLAERGIDAARATLVQRQASALGAGLIAGLANVKVDGIDYDLLVLDRGFVLVGHPGDANEGRNRLRAIVGSAPAAELASRYGFLPFEEIASVTIEKRTPTRATLTLHDGRTVSLKEAWSSELLEKESRNTLLGVLDSRTTR